MDSVAQLNYIHFHWTKQLNSAQGKRFRGFLGGALFGLDTHREMEMEMLGNR